MESRINAVLRVLTIALYLYSGACGKAPTKEIQKPHNMHVELTNPVVDNSRDEKKAVSRSEIETHLQASLQASPQASLDFGASTIIPRFHTIGAYRFSLNGRPYKPEIVYVRGEPDLPAPGDVFYVKDMLMILEYPGDYAFEWRPESPFILFRINKDRKRVLVGLKINYGSKTTWPGQQNPLTVFTAEQLHNLRHITIDSSEIPNSESSIFEKLDFDYLCISMNDYWAPNATERELVDPAVLLPKQVKCLDLQTSGSPNLYNISHLSNLSMLRYLTTNYLIKLGEYEWISGLVNLEYFGSPIDITRLKLLSNLREIRNIAINLPEGVKDISFAAGFSHLRFVSVSGPNLISVDTLATLQELRSINIVGTKVSSIDSLSELPKLTAIYADDTDISDIAEKGFSNLRHLHLTGTKVASQKVNLFKRRHPRCEVLFGQEHGAEYLLKYQLKDVDEVRVRTGGTCHRQVLLERVLVETRSRKTIKALIDSIHIVESEGSFYCMCCGQVAIEFYKGNELVVTLGFHHQQSLRWNEGWSGDYFLTKSSKINVVNWLKQRGIFFGGEELYLEKDTGKAIANRYKKYNDILQYWWIQEAMREITHGSRFQVLETDVEDPVLRAKLLLQLFDCDDAPWNTIAGEDDILRRVLLPGIERKHLEQAIHELISEEKNLDGVARWILGEGQWRLLGEDTLSKILLPIAKRALSNPRPENRRRALNTLGEIGNPNIGSLLTRMLFGGLEPRSIKRTIVDEKIKGISLQTPLDREEVRNGSEKTLVVAVSAKLCLKEGLKNIETLTSQSRGEERKSYERSLKKLRQCK